MAGFLYFADGIVNPLTETERRALALEYAFETTPVSARIDRTPSGVTGTLIADERRLAGATFGYDADAQVWRKRPGDDAVWVGYWRDMRPTPPDLLRRQTVRGEWLTLGDGQRWLAPRLLTFDAEDGFAIDLPCHADLNAAGQWINGDVLADYRPLVPVAERLYEGMLRAELGLAERLSTEELLTITCELLAVNYCVGPLEVALLGLLTLDENLKAVTRVAADFETALAWWEKKSADLSPLDSAGRPTVPGAAA